MHSAIQDPQHGMAAHGGISRTPSMRMCMRLGFAVQGRDVLQFSHGTPSQTTKVALGPSSRKKRVNCRVLCSLHTMGLESSKYQARVSPQMQKDIQESARAAFVYGHFLHASSCCTSAPLRLALAEICEQIARDNTGSSIDLFCKARAALPVPLEHELDSDCLDCDLRGCSTVQDVASLFLQRVVANHLRKGADLVVWSRSNYPYFAFCDLQGADREELDSRIALDAISPLSALTVACYMQDALKQHQVPSAEEKVFPALPADSQMSQPDDALAWSDVEYCHGGAANGQKLTVRKWRRKEQLFHGHRARHKLAELRVGNEAVSCTCGACAENGHSGTLPPQSIVQPVGIKVGMVMELSTGFVCNLLASGRRLFSLTKSHSYWKAKRHNIPVVASLDPEIDDDPVNVLRYLAEGDLVKSSEAGLHPAIVEVAGNSADALHVRSVGGTLVFVMTGCAELEGESVGSLKRRIAGRLSLCELVVVHLVAPFADHVEDSQLLSTLVSWPGWLAL